jgi:hypothetical protein
MKPLIGVVIARLATGALPFGSVALADPELALV